MRTGHMLQSSVSPARIWQLGARMHLARAWTLHR
jgi:hypothetical protein